MNSLSAPQLLALLCCCGVVELVVLGVGFAVYLMVSEG